MKTVINFLYILIVCAAFSISLQAQSSISILQKFGLADGLSSTQFTSFYQDSRSIIWFGTSYGINRYDGTHIQSYTEADGLPSSYILAITEDNNGNLWIKSGDYSKSTYFNSVIDIKTNEILSVEEYLGGPYPFKTKNTFISDVHNNVSIITELHEDKHLFYELKDGILSDAITLQLGNNQTHPAEQCWKKNDGSISAFISKMDLSTGSFNRNIVEFDLTGRIIKSRPIKGDYFHYSRISNNYVLNTSISENHDELNIYLNNNYISKIDSISANNHFITSYNDQFVIYNSINKEFSFYTLPSMSLSRTVHCEADLELMSAAIHFDNQGGIWYPQSESINRLHFQESNFNVVRKFSMFESPEQIRGIVKVEDEVYFSSQSGLNKIQDNAVVDCNLTQFQNVQSGVVGILNNSHKNELLVTTEYHGLYSYSLESGARKQYSTHDNSHKFLWTSHVDKQGKVWAGSDGLLWLNENSNKLHPIAAGAELSALNNSVIYFFYESPEGTWLCTSDGLYLVDLVKDKILSHFHKSKSDENFLPLNHCLHMYEGKDGIKWIATKGQGLIKWNPKTGKYKSYTKSNSGLSHDIVYAVYQDEFGELWLPSNYGLMRFNIEAETVITYFEEDGLPNNEFNTTSHFQDEAGNLYFGGIEGLISFNPKSFNDTYINTPFVLTDAKKINNKTGQEINVSKSAMQDLCINLLPEDRYVDLEFTSINFERKNGNNYCYKIEGFHKNWMYSSDGVVRLIDLPYGNYKLTVRSKPSGASEWITYKDKIAIHVQKPFYFSWWFIVSVIGLILLSVRFYTKRKTRKLKEKQFELENIVKNRTEEIRLKNEELKVLDKAKSNFFANISHEIRTPLSLILGPLSYMLENEKLGTQTYIVDQLKMMQRNGTNLLNLTDEILNLSKLEANKLELSEEPTHTKEFFESLYTSFEPQFQRLGIEAQLDIHPMAQLDILLDREKMKKIINNFLSNAVKFTPKGEKIVLSIDASKRWLNIKVQDTGKGIPAEDVPHVFDRFYQAKDGKEYQKGGISGAGIGLALVKELAKLMQAKVSVESEFGKGSIFHFDLPIKEAERMDSYQTSVLESINEADGFSTDSKDHTILVVEDNLDLRTFIRQMLSKEYKNILTAENGANALALLNKNGANVRLIISDVNMPVMGGFEFVDKVKSTPKLANIPFIMLTAFATEVDKIKALTIGVDDYLSKPFSVPELKARIQNLLDHAVQRQAYVEEENVDPIDSPSKDLVSTPTNVISDIDKAFINELKAFIEDNLENGKLTVEFLAKSIFMGTKKLNRKTKSITGLTTAKFIKEVKLQAARRILEKGNYISIADVAFKTGFEIPTTFSTLYKQRFGVTPTSYSKSVRA